MGWLVFLELDKAKKKNDVIQEKFRLEERIEWRLSTSSSLSSKSPDKINFSNISNYRQLLQE